MTQTSCRFTLSYGYSDLTRVFDTPEAAGRAFALADASLAPRITELRGRAARTLARSTRIGHTLSKGAPCVIDATSVPDAGDRAFWHAFHDAISPALAA